MPRKRGSGSGWVKKDGGNWIGHWYDYSSGAQRERAHAIGSIRELTKKQAREKLAAHIKSFRPNSQMSFEAAARIYIALRRGRWGKNHRQSITSIFDCQINPVLGKRRVADMSPAEIQTFLNELAEFGSESLLKKTVTHIRGVFDMLVEERILDRNPAKSKTVYRPDTRSVDKWYLELWECKALLEAAKDRDYLILRLLLSAALRPSELFGLRVNDIGTRELRIDEVAVPGEKLRIETKTKENAAPVPISEETELLLRAYVTREQLGPNDLLFPSELGTAMSHENWRGRNLARIVKAAGLEGRVDYRILRRTVATHAQKDGNPKDIQALLRHADIKTTLGIYQQAIPESVSATV
ncbi:MAG: site-specific integrase, partial [Acidobacteriaceae bacterium]|nr:site-specific integrase [Acidobacteriaceae bacterium]